MSTCQLQALSMPLQQFRTATSHVPPTSLQPPLLLHSLASWSPQVPPPATVFLAEVFIVFEATTAETFTSFDHVTTAVVNILLDIKAAISNITVCASVVSSTFQLQQPLLHIFTFTPDYMLQSVQMSATADTLSLQPDWCPTAEDVPTI